MVKGDETDQKLKPVAKRWVQRNDTRLGKVLDILNAHQDEPVPPPERSAMQVLVLTILSQNTNDPNAFKAYKGLLEQYPPLEELSSASNQESAGALSEEKQTIRDQYDIPTDEEGKVDSVRIRMSHVADARPSPDWDRMRRADQEEIADCISVCGLQKSKSSAIKNALEWVHEQTESYHLESLIEGLEPDEALDRLSSISGIGTKTAAVTLMEATGMDLCPVDTHVMRVCQRLRLVPPTKSRNKTFRELHEVMPEGKGYQLHHHLITFGRTVCTARNPDCESCFLQRVCGYYRMEEQDEDLTVKFAT